MAKALEVRLRGSFVSFASKYDNIIEIRIGEGETAANTVYFVIRGDDYCFDLDEPLYEYDLELTEIYGRDYESYDLLQITKSVADQFNADLVWERD